MGEVGRKGTKGCPTTKGESARNILSLAIFPKRKFENEGIGILRKSPRCGPQWYN